MERYEQLLKDLETCAHAETCEECSQKENQDGVPECYQIIMDRAAKAIRKQARANEAMLRWNRRMSEDLTRARVSGINGIRAVLELIGAVEAER